MPLFIRLPEIVEAEFQETGLDMLGGPAGIGRPGYLIHPRDGVVGWTMLKGSFEQRYIAVPEGVDAESAVNEIVRFMEPKLAPLPTPAE